MITLEEDDQPRSVITEVLTVVRVNPRTEAWPLVAEAEPVIPVTNRDAVPVAKVINEVDVENVMPLVAP